MEGVSRLGEWMGLKSVLTCEGAHLPYGQAMRSWLPQGTQFVVAFVVGALEHCLIA